MNSFDIRKKEIVNVPQWNEWNRSKVVNKKDIRDVKTVDEIGSPVRDLRVRTLGEVFSNPPDEMETFRGKKRL